MLTRAWKTRSSTVMRAAAFWVRDSFHQQSNPFVYFDIHCLPVYGADAPVDNLAYVP